MRRGLDVGPAVAWEIRNDNGTWSVCYWAQPTWLQLMVSGKKPSPEARCVKVRIVRLRDYQELRRRTR